MDKKSMALHAMRSTQVQLGLHDNLPQLHAAGVGIKRHILGGSHSVVTYPPLHALKPVAKSAIEPSIYYGKYASLYVHIAFCETRCTFCHYTVAQYAGKGHRSTNPAKEILTERYLTALEIEMAHWGARLRATGTSITSVYIGGGTPLILTPLELMKLLKLIRHHFVVETDAAICVEGSPLTITDPIGRAKLTLLKEEGVNRLSFGIQSFDENVLRSAGRGYKAETAVRACEIAHAVFDNWNIDLIQGLHLGSIREVWNNLQMIERIRPPHLTWYHGRFSDRPQATWLNRPSRAHEFETEEETLNGRLLIWQELIRMGYHQIDGNRFVQQERYVDPFKAVRTSLSSDLLGLGASAYSHTADWFFRNNPTIPGYLEAIEAHCLALTSARRLDAEEQLAGSYVVGLRTVWQETAAIRALRNTQPTLADHYDQLIQELTGIGVLAWNGPALSMTQLGRLFEDEILSLFYSPSVQHQLQTP